MRVAMARSGLAAAAFALGTLSGSVRGWTMPAVQRLLPGCTAVRARWVTASTRAPALPAARRPRPPLHVRALAAQAGGGDAQAHPPEFYADLVARRLREANPRAGGGRKRVLFVTGGCWRLRPTVPASLPLALALARPRAPSLSSSRTSLVSPLPRSLSSSNDLSLSHSISSSLPLTTRLPPSLFSLPHVHADCSSASLSLSLTFTFTCIHPYVHAYTTYVSTCMHAKARGCQPSQACRRTAACPACTTRSASACDIPAPVRTRACEHGMGGRTWRAQAREEWIREERWSGLPPPAARRPPATPGNRFLTAAPPCTLFTRRA